MTTIIKISQILDVMTAYSARASTWLKEELGSHGLLVKMVPNRNRYEFCRPEHSSSLFWLVDIVFDNREYKHDLWRYHTDNFFAATQLDSEYSCIYMSRQNGPGWEEWGVHLERNGEYFYCIAHAFDDEYNAILFKLNM